MNVVEEQGLFWWHDEPIPDGHFAPESSVAGLLVVTDEGHITLELNGYLSGPRGPIAALAPRPAKNIQGILKVSAKRAFLAGVQNDGGRFSSHGMSFEKFRADKCLLADREFKPGMEPTFRSFKVELKGLEEWLVLQSIETDRKKTRLTAKYKKPKDIVYQLADGKIEIQYDLEGPWFLKYRNNAVQLRELVWAAFTSKKAMALAEVEAQYLLLQELLVLLTGVEYGLDWPILGTRSKPLCTYYFRRFRVPASQPKLHECWTSFLELKTDFGSIFSNWRSKRASLGPAVYLYLGTRRGVKMYVEHRFVNLVWGIEALHRKKVTPDVQLSTKLAEKIERIVAQVGAAKDRTWLQKKLKFAGEPSLEQRVFETLRALPFEFKKGGLQAFAKRCADRRNEISHFGGMKDGGDYNKFLQDIYALSEALSEMYHALLLGEIGVKKAILDRRMHQNPNSFRTRSLFEAVGLVDKKGE